MLVPMQRRINEALGRDIRKGKQLKQNFNCNDRSGANGVAGALAPGWREAQAGDGRTYYYNEEGQTVWERPLADPSGKGNSSRKNSAPRSTALTVKAKPVIPGGMQGIGKLPRGWRLITGADGKSYYWNKKSGEVSWDPPPPEAEEKADGISDTLSDVKDMIKARPPLPRPPAAPAAERI